MSKKGNSTWINLDDLRSLFSKEEIEARKKEIMEEMALKREKDFDAKELRRKTEQELADKGWTSSNIGQVVREALDSANIPPMSEPEIEIPIPEPVIIEQEESIAEIIDGPIDPKAEEITKLKEQLANLQDVVKDIEKGE